MKTYDIIIVGSGIVGATAALMLAKNPELNIAILEANAFPEKKWSSENYDHRVSAISLSSKKIFQEIKVWETMLNKRVSPYYNMQVWDEKTQGKIHFDCRDVNQASLGFIVEDSVMRSTLLEKMQQCSNIHLYPQTKLINVDEQHHFLNLKTDQYDFKAPLLIGADGANSTVRDLANISLKTWDYHHTAIVTSVETEKSHDETAWQRFLTTGPLAFLPLKNLNTCSIVWSTLPNHAEALLAQSENDFSKTLADAFAHQLGEIKNITTRYHFPLKMRHAKNYVKNRIALIGDSAHTIHPLAGQGVNLGLLDAACLSETIAMALNKKRDFSSFATLRNYERFRKSHNLTMLAAVETFKKMFGNDNSLLKAFRSFGLKTADQNLFLKKFLMNYALGKE